MKIYFIDKTTLEIKEVITANSFSFNLDEETNANSTIVLHKIPNASNNDFIVAKDNEKTQYQGIIDEIQTEKNSNKSTIVCSDISNLFNRKVYVDNLDLMNTSLEDFLFYTINKFFKLGDDDDKIAMSYLSIVQDTATSVTEPLNDDDGIYNFHTFMTNCRQNKNISTEFEIKQNEIVVTIKNIGNLDTINIDTTNSDVINYNKVYEQDITSKVSVKCGDTGNVLNYYLLTDRTISTNKDDENRADGVLSTIYVDEESKALEQATNTFKGNRYNHLVEFEIRADSKLVDTSNLTIGRNIKIKTSDGILESYISSIQIQNTSNYIQYKSGNIRTTLIDKLKQEPYKIGINKVDKSYVKKITTYSNDEQQIGYWIDGKPLYRKTIQYTTTSNTTRITLDSLGLSDIETILIDYGHSYRKWKTATNIALSSANYYNSSSDWGTVYIDGDGKLAYLFNDSSTRYNITTLEYTKPTD